MSIFIFGQWSESYPQRTARSRRPFTPKAPDVSGEFIGFVHAVELPLAGKPRCRLKLSVGSLHEDLPCGLVGTILVEDARTAQVFFNGRGIFWIPKTAIEKIG